jgi:hypothetical protein
LDNGAAADDQIALIKNNSLTGGNCPLGSVKFHTDPTVLLGIYGCGLFMLAVAGLGCDPDRFRQRITLSDIKS